MEKKIIKLLHENARYSNEDLAVMLGISSEEVADLIDSLIERGIIKGFKPLIDWDKTGSDYVTALIQLGVTPERDKGFEEIAEEIMLMKEVETVYLMSGGYDLTVIVCGKSFKEVAMFVAKRLAPMKSVTSTATHFVLRRYKELGVCLADENVDDRGLVSP